MGFARETAQSLLMSVPLSTIKSALRIDYDDDDTELVRLREAAISLIERRTSLTLTPQTLYLYLSQFKDTLVPGSPYTSATSVTYKDVSGSTITMPTTDWWIDQTDGPMPMLRFLQVPSIKDGTAITFTYLGGYATLPNEVTHAVIALVGGWYNNPEAWQPIGLQAVPFTLEYIIEAISNRSPLR